MLIPQQALYTLVIGIGAAASLEWIAQPGGPNEPSTRPPTKLPSWSHFSHWNMEGDEKGGDEAFGAMRRNFSGREHDGLEERQVASARPPTVFSTQTVTSTITTSAGLPITSTIIITRTSTLTILDPAKGLTTETLTVTSSPGPQKRTIPWVDSLPTPTTSLATAGRVHPDSMVTKLDNLSRDSSLEKRETKPATVTSVIILISRTVVTVAPTILVTSAAIVLSTLTVTPSISATTTLTTTIVTGPNGSPTTLLPSTTTLPTPSATSSTAPSSTSSSPTNTSTTQSLSNGTIGGIVVGSIFGAALLLALFVCCKKRRKRKPQNTLARKSGCFSTLTSTSSLGTSDAAEHGTVTHHETFGVGASPPASVARSASEEQQQQQSSTPPAPPPPPTTKTIEETRVVIKPPSPAMTQVPAAGAARAVGRTFASPLWRPGAMEASHSSSRAGMSSMFGDDDDEDGSSGFYSNEAQPPSPVASSGIFGPSSPTASLSARSSFRQLQQQQQPLRDTWASSGGLSMSTVMDLSMEDSAGGWERPGTGGRMETMWRSDEEEEDMRESWIPPFPEPGRGKSKDEGQGRSVRFEDVPTAFGRSSEGGSGSGSASSNGSKAFL